MKNDLDTHIGVYSIVSNVEVKSNNSTLKTSLVENWTENLKQYSTMKYILFMLLSFIHGGQRTFK